MDMSCHMVGHSRLPIWLVMVVGRSVPAQWMLDQIRHDSPALWIDESPMNLYEILGFQPKGVATSSFSSR